MFDYQMRTGEGAVDNTCMQALTLAFIENQVIDEIYEPESGFCRGTAFPELDKPWCPGGDNK